MILPRTRTPLSVAVMLSAFCLSSVSAHGAEGPTGEPRALVFTSFRKNGQDGLYLAYSRDGLAWTPLNGNRPILEPQVGRSKLMRDPSIAQDADGVFHMVWTTGWQEQGFGYARSRDLMRWSEQRFVPVERGDLAEGVRNTWAPDLFYDERTRRFLIVWSSTRVSQPEKDHRMYLMDTRDFDTFSEPRLFYDPGYRCIDGTIVQDGKRYVLVFKDERDDQKVLRLATAEKPDGPYGPPSDPLPDDGVEGPSALVAGDETIVYYDHYRSPRHYGALKTTDWHHWVDLTPKLTFPEDHRHGTVLEVAPTVLDGLLALPAPATSRPG